MRERVRVAVVGVGRWGRLHAEKFASMRGAELIGVVDIVPERARLVASALGTRPYFDYRELLGKVDAVSIVTPTNTHYEIAKAFLEAKVDVFLEKPMTQALTEAHQLGELSRKGDLILQVGHLERFNGALFGIDGFLKDPERVRAVRLSPFSERSLDVDVVLDLMIHDIDLLCHLLDLKVRTLEAEGKRVKSPLADEVQVTIWTEDGRKVELVASRVAPEKVRSITFFQPHGQLTLDLLRHRFVFKGNGTLREGGSLRDSLREELSSFLESVRNRRPPVVGPSDGIRALEVALSISEAVHSQWAKGTS